MTSDGATNLVERIEIVSVEAVEDSVSNNVNLCLSEEIIKKKKSVISKTLLHIWQLYLGPYLTTREHEPREQLHRRLFLADPITTR